MGRNAKILKECLDDYNAGRLFEKWFIDAGKAYYFLFKKNLKVTNIQFAELIALIKIHAKDIADESIYGNKKIGNKLQFLSVQQFNTGMREMVKTFSSTDAFEKSGKEKIYQEISNIYSDLLSFTIVVDSFYGSCAIFIPPGIDIDLSRICASSGYIHSCGRRVFFRNMNKYETRHFHHSLEKYLYRLPENKKKILFCIYAHEDFSEYDRGIADELKNGLDDVKIFEEKYFMGELSMVSLLHYIETNFPGKFIIPSRGNFKKERDEILKTHGSNIDRDRTLWLIKDHAVNPSTLEHGSYSYYICYEQLFVNENQFHLFDENKPAWKSSTTMPHTLTSAMINIALSDCQEMYKKEIDKIVIGDPCVGTGTTWLECLKYDFLHSNCSDIDLLSDILISDNLEFFSMSVDELKKFEKTYSDTIIQFKEDLDKEDTFSGNKNLTSYYKTYYEKTLVPLLNLIPKNNKGEFDFDEDTIAILNSKSFEDRFPLYILLRVKLKYKSKFERIGSEDIRAPFIKEMEKILKQIKYFSQIKNRSQSQERLEFNKEGFNVSFHQSNYSLGTFISEQKLISKFKEIVDNRKIFKAGLNNDIKNMPNEYFDIIIIDPPYGFNTSIDGGTTKLAEDYQDIIRSTIRALKNNGQIIMALPDRSLSGKISPIFTHKEIVLHEYLRIAEEEGKEIVLPAKILPSKEIFKPPFYWEAEKALRRSIIQLRVSFKNPPKVQK